MFWKRIQGVIIDKILEEFNGMPALHYTFGAHFQSILKKYSIKLIKKSLEEVLEKYLVEFLDVFIEKNLKIIRGTSGGIPEPIL